MQRIAVFPGSFDPITRGHESIIRRALPLFDHLIVAIGENDSKRPFFQLPRRLDWISTLFRDDKGIEIATFSGLTIDFCRDRNASYILRGLRTAADFEFERSIAQMNKLMYPDVETVFILSTPEFAPVSSSIVRDIIRHGGDVRMFVPDVVKPYS
jgi:pantetheine-phosphate adenylyltransferase